MFKKHISKLFWCNPNNPEFDLFKLLGERILYISKLRKENVVNGVIHRITEDFEKNSHSDKIKRIKTICQKHFTKLWEMKKLEKQLITNLTNN